MKKLMILVSAVALSGTMFAQKGTTDNPWTLEGSIDYKSSTGFDWDAPSVRARYFFKDNMAGRLNLGYSSTSFDDSNSVSGNSIGLGFEYHLAGNDKMSPYFSAGLNFGGSNTTINNVEAKTSSLGLGIGAGLDYYVAENIYLGLEIGLLNYGSATSGEGDNEVTTSGMNLGGGSSIRMGWRF
jgi:opacity protein-like surface antigen